MQSDSVFRLMASHQVLFCYDRAKSSNEWHVQQKIQTPGNEDQARSFLQVANCKFETETAKVAFFL